MKTTWGFSSCLIVILLGGCASTSKQLLLVPSKPTNTIRFILDSEPSGAEVQLITASGVRAKIGITPYTIELGLAEQREKSFLGFTKHKKWHIFNPPDMCMEISEARNRVTLISPEMTLVKSGYKLETTRVEQEFGGEFDLIPSRTNHNARKPVSIRKTVYFTTPTEQQHDLSILVESKPSGAAIYQMNKDGTMGAFVANTPHTAQLGFAEVRYPNGGHKDWLRWSEEDIWTHTNDGHVILNCFLVKDGYEPEKMKNRRVGQYGRRTDWAKRQDVVFQLIHPSKPFVQFKLLLDSLPTGATVYAISDDGSIGRELGKTPLECEIGLAQEQYEEGMSGQYYHKEWKVWAPQGFIRWYSASDSVGHVNMSCALYKDGFAVERVIHEVCALKPGMSGYPESKTVTIPLPTHQQAAIREQNKFQVALLGQQRDWDVEMERQKREWDKELQARQQALAQQASGGQTVIVKRDPHFGKEWQTGMGALGSVIRPFSKIGPLETEQHIQALQGLGTLVDLMNRNGP